LLEVLHQIPNREIRGIALAVVAKLLARLKCVDVGRGQRLGFVAEAFERALDQPLVFPGESAE
jgi:hypothetical protein